LGRATQSAPGRAGRSTARHGHADAFAKRREFGENRALERTLLDLRRGRRP